MGALAASVHAAETGGIQFEAIEDPLAKPSEFLPVDRAFVFSSSLRVGDGGVDEIVARWDMPPGYYLYGQRFFADAREGLTLGELTIPPGELRTDEYFGESEVYLGSVEIVVPVLKRSVETATVRFGYQGCAERGLCYPPVERTTTFHFAQTPPPSSSWRRWVWVAGATLLLAAAWLARSMRSRRDVS